MTAATSTPSGLIPWARLTPARCRRVGYQESRKAKSTNVKNRPARSLGDATSSPLCARIGGSQINADRFAGIVRREPTVASGIIVPCAVATVSRAGSRCWEERFGTDPWDDDWTPSHEKNAGVLFRL